MFHDTINLPCSVKLISFFIGTCWYFKALFMFIRMYWGLGGKLNLRIISDPCFQEQISYRIGPDNDLQIKIIRTGRAIRYELRANSMYCN